MGLHDDITAALADAFDTDLADAVTTFTGTRRVNDVPAVVFAGRGVFGRYAAKDIDGQRVLSTDKRLVALADEVTGGTPQVNDRVNGLNVIGVGIDAAGVAWKLQLRG